MDGLTEGRIVHYVLEPGVHLPAIVTRIWDRHSGCVNLTVFADTPQRSRDFGDHTRLFTSICHSDEKTPATWHWIERA